MFKRTRLKLTAWYVLMVMLVSLFFSLVIFQMLSVEVDRFARAQQVRFQRQFNGLNVIVPPPQFDKDLVEETKNRIILNLLFVNGTILIFAGIIGYVLSGITLKPIALMVEEQKRFVSDASHELRTPLTALKSMLEVSLRDKNLNLKDSKNIISESIQEVDKLTSLSDSLLELARENGNQKINFQKISVKRLFQESINKINIIAEAKQIKIISKSGNCIVVGNKDKLSQLLVILLDNAIKYSPQKSQIKISAQNIKNNTVIKVVDQGIGIDKNDLPHIFERFYRADSARAHQNEGGYGLGLSIAKKIVDTYHGTITVNSLPNKGTVFTIKIPLLKIS